MCNFCSAIITKDRVFFGWSDYPERMDKHETIIDLHNLHADGPHGPNIVRVECEPPRPGAPLAEWAYRVDQTYLPDWYDAEHDEARVRRAIEEAQLAPLYADHSAKRAPLDADYSAKLAKLDADYSAKLAPLYADYSAKRAPLYADYSAKLAKLDADYSAKRKAIAERKW